MKFRLADADMNFAWGRMVSEGGRWELGYSPVFFGCRVRLGLVRSMSVELDYCAGDDPELRLEILLLVLQIVEPLDEATTQPADIQRIFPRWTRRPIDLDPICMHQLRRLAETS